MDNIQDDFDQAYWAAQPPEVRALPEIEDPAGRATRGAQLATQGFTIDVPIMVWGWDPYLVMKMRSDYGYTWVPSALQPPVSVVPGVSIPGIPPYDPANPPAGSITVPPMSQLDGVSADDSAFLAKYYPPFSPAAGNGGSASAAPPSDPVGAQSLGNLYLSVAGDTYQDGAKYTDGRGAFLKHVVVTPFGRTSYWEKIA